MKSPAAEDRVFIRLLRQPDSERDPLRVSGDARSKFLPLLDTASKGEERRGVNKGVEKAGVGGEKGWESRFVINFCLKEAIFFRDEKVKKGNIWVAYS
ncbi:hypothetical protein NDU88_001329 [Pleurodeles waltl]|uniref:Uncharacterized protein n=1 Tax=Pleurodeles waltl TaxID=8319 RepID=A0AAV7VW52_PLEWA|nr:hypothetical protein NDU88_001329 [Pleurodeles waltl]